MRLNRQVGRERIAGLKRVVEKVQILIRERKHIAWSMATVEWTEHTMDEVLRRISSMGKDSPNDMVRNDRLDGVIAIMGSGFLRDRCFEDRLLRYMVVRGISDPEGQEIVAPLGKRQKI